MTPQGRAQSSLEEFDRAEEELRAADELCNLGLPRVALTRAYYAVFHAMRGLLFGEGEEPRSHGGVIHLFNVTAVKTGRLPPDTSARVAKLQKFREEADYAEAFVVDPAATRLEVKAARALVEEIRGLVKAS